MHHVVALLGKRYQLNWQTLSQLTSCCSDALCVVVQMCCPALLAVEISVMADEKIYCQSVGQSLYCTSSISLEHRILYYCVRRNQLVSWVLSPRLSRAPNGTRPNPI